MAKLEPRHLSILRRLADGDLLMFVRGMTPHVYWYGTAGTDAAPYRAALDLWAFGLVETAVAGGGDFEFDINETGRTALADGNSR